MTEKRSGIFTKAVLKEAILLLPTLPETSALAEVRLYLRNNLHYNAEQTRHRYANYIVNRIFPSGLADKAVRLFAKYFQGSRDLQEICFYRFLKAEPLELQVILELLIPNIGTGRISRSQIRNYLTSRFPLSRSIIDGAKAIVDALRAGGLAKADYLNVKFAYRDISIPAFAFILHSEFPEPGMYDISKIETNSVISAMLWNPDRLMPSLYELKNRGLISKVSNIDNIRQFTTRWTLDEVVERLIARQK